VPSGSALDVPLRCAVEAHAQLQRRVREGPFGSVVKSSVLFYVTRTEDGGGTVDTPVYFTPAESATTVVLRLDGEFADAQRLIIAIEAYGASALSGSKKSALQKAATELGGDRAAIRRCIDIIMAAIGNDGVSR
jgi:hypothetical protein